MMKNLCEEFRRYHGQPVKIFTDDRRTHTGLVIDVYEDCVRIVDKCGRLFLIEFCHIDAVEEPQMKLRHCHGCSEGFDEDEGRKD